MIFPNSTELHVGHFENGKLYNGQTYRLYSKYENGRNIP
jgi:hypothetical protein